MLAKLRVPFELKDEAMPDLMKEESANEFATALMSCHQLTLHLMAHHWPDDILTWFYPMSAKMEFWRRKDKKLFLDDRNNCNFCSLRPNICHDKKLKIGQCWNYHFHCGNAHNSPYHNAVRVYMEYCTEHLFYKICYIVNKYRSPSSYTTPVGELDLQDEDVSVCKPPTIDITNNFTDDDGNCQPLPYARKSDKVPSKPDKKVIVPLNPCNLHHMPGRVIMYRPNLIKEVILPLNLCSSVLKNYRLRC